jgi:hypothetical protein
MSAYGFVVAVAFTFLTSSLLAGYGWFFRRSLRDGADGESRDFPGNEA